MKRTLLFSSLLVLNGVLAGGLIWNLRKSPVTSESEARPLSTSLVSDATHWTESKKTNVHAVRAPVVLTPFGAVYSARPSDFVANLRRVGCPEETIKDILFAEVNRQYHVREEELRPKPADHVPWSWSPKTSEAKLLERRQQTASIAREKEGILRSALGYDVNVPMPLYAMTVSDQRFQQEVQSIPPNNRQAAHQAQEQYWSRVEQLRDHTRGFWESSDIEELNRLKRERAELLEGLIKE